MDVGIIDEAIHPIEPFFTYSPGQYFCFTTLSHITYPVRMRVLSEGLPDIIWKYHGCAALRSSWL